MYVTLGIPPRRRSLGLFRRSLGAPAFQCGDVNSTRLVDCWRGAGFRGLGAPPAKHAQAVAMRHMMRSNFRGLGAPPAKHAQAVAMRHFLRTANLTGLEAYTSSGFPLPTVSRVGRRGYLTLGDDNAFLDTAPVYQCTGPDDPLCQSQLPASDVPPQIPMAPFPNLAPPAIVYPAASKSTILAAAAAPNASAVAKQLAAQLQKSGQISASDQIGAWFQSSAIAGIPNYLLAGGAGFLVLIAGMKKRY